MTQISNIKYRISSFVRHPLFSGSLIMVGGSMMVNAINYLYHLIMGRVLGPINYGTLASLYSVLYIVSIVPTSTSIAITKFISGAKDDKEAKDIYQAINSLIFLVAILLSVLILVISPLISSFLHIDNIWNVILISPILLLILITLVNQAASQGILKFSGSVGPNLVSAIVKFIVGLGLVFIGWSVLGAMTGIVVGSLLAYFFSRGFVSSLAKARVDKEYNLGPFLKYSFPVLAQALAFTSFFTTDVILVKHFLPAFDAGLYAALSTLGKVIFFAASPVSATMFPIVSKRKTLNQSYLKVFLAAFLVTILLSIVIVVFYYLFPNLAIGILYGKAYLGAKAELVWMGAFLSFYSLSYFLINFMLSLGKTRVVLLPLLVATLQVILIWLWHGSLLQVIQISLGLSFFLFVGLTGVLVYNFLVEEHE